MKATVSIQIPKPCTESWATMNTVDDLHRHCAACDKVLTDFSGMSDTEIVLWFKNNNGKVCGRFAPGQLNRALVLPAEKTEKKKYWLNALWLIPFAWGGNDAKAQTATPEVIRSKPPVSVRTTQPSVVEATADKVTTAVTVSGTVRAAETNKPVTGCTVHCVIDGKSFSVKTDAKGNYKLELPEGKTDEVMLRFYLPGYQSQAETIHRSGAVNGKVTLDVKFEEREMMLKGDVGLMITPASESQGTMTAFFRKVKALFGAGNNDNSSIA
jgi:hypothetical protein